MSREFGEHGYGFFHNKINDALLDAKEEGHTRGAMVMAAFLEPLYEIAYAVSSEEEGDSSESFVVETIVKQLPQLREAMRAAEHYVAPAIDLAVKTLAKRMENVATITEESDGAWIVRVPKSFRREEPFLWEMEKDALRHLVCQHAKQWAHRCSSSCGGEDDYVEHKFAVWGHPEKHVEWLYETLRETQKEVAFLRLQQENSKCQKSATDESD